jgi:hypothetical protein
MHAPVEARAQQGNWRQAVAKAAVRSAASAVVSARKADQLFAAAQRLPVHAPEGAAEDALLTRAMAHYNAFHSDQAFRARISVNDIRHQLMSYAHHLEQVAVQAGVRQAVMEIRRRVYRAIARTYPQYTAECQRQLALCASGADGQDEAMVGSAYTTHHPQGIQSHGRLATDSALQPPAYAGAGRRSTL